MFALNSSEFKDHIKEVLEQACAKFRKKELKAKCDEVVEKNADFIINAIADKMDPKKLCHGLGLCEANPTEVDDLIEEASEQLMQKYSETPQCVLCELIATKLEADLKKNSTQDAIEKAVRGVCRSLPSKLSVKCKKFVEDYADLVISLLATVPPKELCGELNFCRSNSKKDTSQQDIFECGLCYTTVDALAMVLEKNGPKDHEIVTETTCHLMPAKFNHQVCWLQTCSFSF